MEGNKLNEIFRITRELLEKELGKDFKFSDGDTFCFEMNDCTVAVTYEDGDLQYRFSDVKPFKVDFTTGFYVESDEEE